MLLFPFKYVGIKCSSFALILILIGFGVNGIVAGSFAAMIQAYIGNVAAGSAFSFFTSWGMKGLLWKIFTIGSLTAVFASDFCFCSKNN